MKFDWNNEESVRGWLQIGSTAIRGFAEMMSMLADMVDADMPPAAAAPEAPGSSTRPDWKDANSIRAWLESVNKALRITAEMMISLAATTEARMPPAEGKPGTRSCSFCGKAESETPLYAGRQGNICPSCARAADAGEPTGEARQPETKAECYAAWKRRNMKSNEVPGDLRGVCWWVSSGLLRYCLKHAS